MGFGGWLTGVGYRGWVVVVLGQMCEVDCGQKQIEDDKQGEGTRKECGKTDKQKNKMGKEYKRGVGWGGLTNRLHGVEKNKRTSVRRKAQRERPT